MKNYIGVFLIMFQKINMTKRFEIALSAYQSYTLNELDEFFRKSPPVYNMVGISGSGGSNIAKPNIGTLTAYHLAKIFQVEILIFLLLNLEAENGLQ